MSFLYLAFLMGFLGSLHCAVMCGPIMLGLPLQKQHLFENAVQLFLYQLGRITVYVFLGILVGALGNSLSIFANQEILSLVIGVLFVVFAVVQLSGLYVGGLRSYQLKLITPLSRLMGKVLRLRFWGFFAGLLNGLIPCGMVYLALTTALSNASAQSGAMFMLMFGLGTAPLMFFVSFGGVYLKKYIKFNIQKLLPWFMLLMGILFTARSLNLGIPFLSPSHHAGYSSGVYCG
ncbi:sulfite exporter TauE/SafE family protein [Pedobacter sp. ASV28]|uniref:sulfite exporter TauE/SafE family protein n=1 Tax=Pedobacter sp. ASV28 TaxID=2795123 RepID=UPI0018EBB957|nr:sulfite exporter TauE/SafE family protein [Pedobacter sp. ASV28]